MNASKCLLPTAYLPNLFYISLFLRFKSIIIEQYESYPKQTYRNRCEILTSTGVLPLSIPVSKGNALKMHTKDIEIVNLEPWQIKHWRAIESAYSNSPYFLYYSDYFKAVYYTQYNKLIDFNDALLKIVLKILHLQNDILYTQGFEKETSCPDYRDSFKPNVKCLPAKAFEPYYQVFSARDGFCANLSIIDLIFNIGPDAIGYLQSYNSKLT